MIVQTSRFGPVEVNDDRVITFAKGLLGFSSYHQYVLIQPSEDSYFFWLQSIESPELAFVVTDPSLFINGYEVPLKPEQMRELGLEDVAEAQVFVIVNKRGNVLTGNLQGPLVVHAHRRIGDQLVLSDRRFHTRVPLLELSESISASA